MLFYISRPPWNAILDRILHLPVFYSQKFHGVIQGRIKNFPRDEGVRIHYSTKFYWKLHENEENWAERGGASKILDPPLGSLALWFGGEGGLWSQEGEYGLPVNRLTDTCENITLPQLRFGR